MLKSLCTLLLISASAFAGPALFVDQVNPYSGNGVGLSSWTHFTSDLNAAFGGAANVTVSNAPLPPVGSLSVYSALLIDASSPGDVFSATEVANLQAFIATGRPVVFIGENTSWSSWDNSIMAAVHGVYSGVDVSGPDTPAVSNSLTCGVESITWIADGTAIGGTSLFQHNVATLWSPDVLSILSLNALDDFSFFSTNNARFDVNVAAFLASTPTPEPSTLGFCSLTLLALGLAYLRARAK